MGEGVEIRKTGVRVREKLSSFHTLKRRRIGGALQDPRFPVGFIHCFEVDKENNSNSQVYTDVKANTNQQN